MNFIKNSFNKLFGKQEEKPATKEETEQPVDVPEQELLQLFELAAKALSASKQPVSDEAKLQLYGLYKQATVGDCNTPKPALYEFVNKAKWDSWSRLKGMGKLSAIKSYISTAVSADPTIQQKLLAELQGENYEEGEVVVKNKQDSIGLKMAVQTDFSDSYSHPYFKRIEKGEAVDGIEHALLLQVNNSPKVYPLHFAIDKERADLVEAFLALLTAHEIQEMRDEEGTGILEYA